MTKLNKLNIISALKEARLTQYELAKKLNTSPSLISNWINGNVTPSNTNLEKLSKILNKPSSDFTEEKINYIDVTDHSNIKLLTALEEPENDNSIQWELVYKNRTDGYTRASFLMLRDVLVKLFTHEIAVIEVEIEEHEKVHICGFLVIDKTEYKAYWSGSGFGKNYAGTGPNGRKRAIEFILAMGLHNHELPEPVKELSETEFKNSLINIAKDIYQTKKGWFSVPIMCTPNF
ncbi:MAG: helix-turn-helix transcriptional regulator [Endomicrobiales bacterium]|nr:helix-turn-helix transcriptional regulator [Endomicrobiales bacterium]